MTDRVIEEMMDSFRQSEQHWSRLMYLVEQVGNHSTNAKKPDIGTINEPHLSLDEISDKMLDEIREMKQRQDCAMEYLQQLYATNLQCLMKITALKEENEQLKVSQRQTVQKLQARVSSALHALDEQESHYLKHFSHSVALEDFWRNILPTLPETDPFKLQEEFQPPRSSSTRHHELDSGRVSRLRIKREVVNKWESDCAKVMKYMSVYCMQRLKRYATTAIGVHAGDDPEKFIQLLLKEVKRLGRKVDTLRASMITLPSDSEDSLERLSTKRSEIHVADYREMRDRLEESRAYIQQLQKQLKDFNCNMRKQQELVHSYKQEKGYCSEELQKKTLYIQQLEKEIATLKDLLVQRPQPSPKKQRTPPKLETILLSSPRYRDLAYPVSSSAVRNHSSALFERHTSNLTPNDSFLDVENLWTPIKVKAETPVRNRYSHKNQSSSLDNQPMDISTATVQSESLLGEDLSLVLSSSSFHHLHPSLGVTNYKPNNESHSVQRLEKEQKTLSLTCSNTETVSFAISSNADESKTISPDASFADITLEDLANSKFPI